MSTYRATDGNVYEYGTGPSDAFGAGSNYDPSSPNYNQSGPQPGTLTQDQVDRMNAIAPAYDWTVNGPTNAGIAALNQAEQNQNNAPPPPSQPAQQPVVYVAPAPPVPTPTPSTPTPSPAAVAASITSAPTPTPAKSHKGLFLLAAVAVGIWLFS